jgi:hypothetical protein
VGPDRFVLIRERPSLNMRHILEIKNGRDVRLSRVNVFNLLQTTPFDINFIGHPSAVFQKR